MIRALLAALLMLVATPAWADTTAIYKSPTLGAEMRIEIAANGNMRNTMGANGTYYLSLDGEDYIVFFTDKGAVVARMSDVAAVMADYMEKLSPDFFKRPPPADTGFAINYIQGGQMTVQGRPGIVWYRSFGDDEVSSLPMTKIVMSADPALAELGRSWARQLTLSMKMMPPAFAGLAMNGMLDVLNTGTPILINGMELTEVNHAPIAPERFALPATPETREQVRVRFEASGGHIP